MDLLNQKMNEFLKSHQEKLYKLALYKTSDPEAALDVVQETMFAMVKKYMHNSSKEWAYIIYKILSRKIIDWKRKTFFSKLKLIFSDENMEANEKSELGMNQEEIDNSINQINLEMKLLSEKQRDIIWLKFYGDYTFVEISRIMGINLSSVKTHYYRALEKLKKSNTEVCYE